MIRDLSAFASGAFFGIGLGLAGMTMPDKVIDFLDLAENWDPSLAFVMVGAIAVHLVSYRLILKRPSPVLDAVFHLPRRHEIDGRLLLGSGIFGIGWAVGGYCPGPGLVSIGAGGSQGLLFVASMTAGMLVFHALDTEVASPSGAEQEPTIDPADERTPMLSTVSP